MKAQVNPKSTSNQSSKPCTVLQYPSKKVCKWCNNTHVCECESVRVCKWCNDTCVCECASVRVCVRVSLESATRSSAQCTLHTIQKCQNYIPSKTCRGPGLVTRPALFRLRHAPSGHNDARLKTEGTKIDDTKSVNKPRVHVFTESLTTYNHSVHYIQHIH